LKLYEIPKESIIYIECSDGSSYLTFKHLDGAYSYCITEHGNVNHLSVNTELEPISQTEFILKE
jgi:hypothetical protein